MRFPKYGKVTAGAFCLAHCWSGGRERDWTAWLVNVGAIDRLGQSVLRLAVFYSDAQRAKGKQRTRFYGPGRQLSV